MPSDLQRVARGLVQCLDEVPQVVLHLQRTADRCRENAALAIAASHGRATVAAHQLDAAARACEQAAHYLSMAPPKARAWAETLVGDGRSTNRPGTASADRNRATGGAGESERDDRGRTRRLTLKLPERERGDREDLPAEESDRLRRLAEGKEPPLVDVARKAFEKYRRRRERDEERREEPEPLEVELVVAESGEVAVLARDKDERELAERLAEYEDEDEDEDDQRVRIEVELAAAELLKAMADRWQKARLLITGDRVTATFEYEDLPEPRLEESGPPVVPVPPPVIDVELPDTAVPDTPADTPEPIAPPVVAVEPPEPAEVAPEPARDDLDPDRGRSA